MWIVDKLQNNVDKYKYISEKQIKFELYNYMLSGIPDLVLLPSTGEVMPEIWDFKTGQYEKGKLAPYEFQLSCYAYALYKKGIISQESPIKLVLCFIDEERLVDKIVSLFDVENYLSGYFLQLNSPDRLNLDNCTKCTHKVICQK